MNTASITYATLPEVMIYQVARTIQDGELVFHGYGSPVPTLAMLLAKRTHAPHMIHVEGATYGINPDPPFLPPTSNDWALERERVMALGISDLASDWRHFQTGKVRRYALWTLGGAALITAYLGYALLRAHTL